LRADKLAFPIQIRSFDFAKMTVATDKLVYDISPAKTDSFKPVDQF